jgi:5,10-methylenetetrahydromethanopterin reductase
MPSAFARRAKRAEASGYDGITIVDSQNLSGDCYVGLAAAAAQTTRIRVGTGVTNPFTRHAAVTACAIATVHAASGGRAVLGIGRGDSALAHLGHAPASPDVLAHYLDQLQGYLRGEEVPFDESGDLARLDLAHQPTGSRIQWLRPGRYSKVPVDVAATGPKVIAIAARLADRVTFAVGADPTRLRWAIDTARSARATAHLDRRPGPRRLRERRRARRPGTGASSRRGRAVPLRPLRRDARHAHRADQRDRTPRDAGHSRRLRHDDA